ncbi:MAG: hypothetical protein O6939_02070 [Bacteroidetes bacterium]|nr:hypothetical protein [Bacteroidota bacterium]
MKPFKTLLLAALFLSTTCFGQTYLFKVLASKGTNQVKSSSESSWRPIKTGSGLMSGDELKVPQNAYLGLVHTSGKTIELKTADQVNVDELAANIKLKSTVASKYADFVLNKLLEDKSEIKDKLVVTGAVIRASEVYSIKVQMPLFVEVLRSEVLVKWEPVKEGNHTYVTTLKNIFNEVIYQGETKDTEITLDLSHPRFVNERLIVFSVASKEDPNFKSEEYGIKRLSPNTFIKVKQDLDQLNKVIGDETSLNHIMMAAYYEENNLIVNAITSFEKAIELSPDVQDFSDMYDAFLERNNLKN